MSHRNDCRLYVGNLPTNVKEYEIEDLFRKYGNVVSVDIKEPRNGRGLPFAFVEMDHRHAADDAVRRRNGYYFDGYRIRVEFPKGSYERGRSSSFIPRRSKNAVVVSGLPPTGSWQDLKDHMRDCGDIAYADVFGGGKGVVSFIRREDMLHAVKKMNDSKFRSHKGETAYIRVHEDNREESGSSRSRSRSPIKSKRKWRRSRSSSARGRSSSGERGRRSRSPSAHEERSRHSRSPSPREERGRRSRSRSAPSSVSNRGESPDGDNGDVRGGSSSRSVSRHSDDN